MRHFEVCLKVPGDAGFVYTPTSEYRSDIHIWISGVLGQMSWDGWYMYNDRPPSAKIHYHSDGHCKGVVLWNEREKKACWLVHSVSEWPVNMPIEALPETAQDEGHSFAFWLGDIKVLPKIEAQVDLMHARVYAGRRSSITSEVRIGTLQRIKLDATTDHVAKNKRWGRDVYPSLGRCHVQSRASLDDTKTVYNMVRVDLPGWVPERDHSLWAVGDSWVCVGDIRRGKQEFEFGGGCMISYDEALASRIRKIVG